MRRERILALDLLRGYFLAVMVVDHLGFFPSIFELASGRGELWVSAAEGFFIISGMLVGYVYGPRMAKNAALATKKMLHRAAKIYIWAVLLTWLFVWWAHHVDVARAKAGLWLWPPVGDFLYKTLTLQYSYGWADFLQYYVIFLVAAPLALWLCVKGRPWLVLAGSFLAWTVRGQGFELAWQLLFMGGIVTGYYLPQLEQRVRSWPAARRRNAARALYVSASAVVGLSALTVQVSSMYLNRFGAGNTPFPAFWHRWMLALDRLHTLTNPWVTKWTMPPMRIAVALTAFAALYVFARTHEQAINRLTRGSLKALGQNSLFVYGLHAVVVFNVLLVLPGGMGFVLNTVYTGLVLAGIYVITKYHRQVARGSKQALLRVGRLGKGLLQAEDNI